MILLSEVRQNILDIIYNSQLNEFVINKHYILYGRNKKTNLFYNFDPDSLEELVTKRKSYSDFNNAINLMNISIEILNNKIHDKESTYNKNKDILGKKVDSARKKVGKAKKKNLKVTQGEEQSVSVSEMSNIISNIGEREKLGQRPEDLSSVPEKIDTSKHKRMSLLVMSRFKKRTFARQSVFDVYEQKKESLLGLGMDLDIVAEDEVDAGVTNNSKNFISKQQQFKNNSIDNGELTQRSDSLNKILKQNTSIKQSTGSRKPHLKGYTSSFKSQKQIAQSDQTVDKINLDDPIHKVLNILFISNQEFKINIDSRRLKTFILSYALHMEKIITCED